MHEKVKEFLGKTGTSHDPEHSLHEEEGTHHESMANFEKKALEGKEHHHDVEL